MGSGYKEISTNNIVQIPKPQEISYKNQTECKPMKPEEKKLPYGVYEFKNIELDIGYDGTYKYFAEWIKQFPNEDFVCSGTFFYRNPLGKIVKNGKVLNEGSYIPHSAVLNCKPISITEKGNCDTYVSGLAWLVKDSKVYTPKRRIYPNSKTRRIALGVKGYIVYLVERESDIHTVAKLLQELGCTEAVAMDGGGSAAMHIDDSHKQYYKTTLYPTRKLNNVIMGHYWFGVK